MLVNVGAREGARRRGPAIHLRDHGLLPFETLLLYRGSTFRSNIVSIMVGVIASGKTDANGLRPRLIYDTRDAAEKLAGPIVAGEFMAAGDEKAEFYFLIFKLIQ
ncbi:hypothetical protein GWI33_015289 [Rhynchophorus ferrugineus]|uniref:Uncharacterized protein n=1 Tax=Rhynchophorus ferrugineus TaxID=354439 RepID=A0A834I5N0_RHYFE|nr:hypothetical protein GWI33_015289 [Rhynchophorus ferrugineus]